MAAREVKSIVSNESTSGGGLLPRPDLPESHPQNVPLKEWMDGWLKMSIAVHLGRGWLWLNGHEKRSRGLPYPREEMVAFLVGKGDVPAAGVSRHADGVRTNG